MVKYKIDDDPSTQANINKLLINNIQAKLAVLENT